MTLINIIGDVRNGKTLFATYLATKSTVPVYANYRIDIPNFNELHPEMLITLHDGSTIVIDEAYSWLEARLSGSGQPMNLYLSYVLFQSGKNNMNIITTDQLLETIDTRFRTMANYEVYCEKKELPNHQVVGFEYTIQQKSRYHRYEPIKVYWPVEYASKYYPLFNTKQVIQAATPALLHKIATNKEAQWDEIVKHARFLIDSVKEIKLITKAVVGGYCKQRQIDYMTQDIYDAVKAIGVGV